MGNYQIHNHFDKLMLPKTLPRYVPLLSSSLVGPFFFAAFFLIIEREIGAACPNPSQANQASRRPIKVHHNIVGAPDNTVCSPPFNTSHPNPS
jgi:hypothetical protein